MKINRVEILQKLEILLPGIADRDIIEQSKCFIFKDGKIVSFNDEVACFCDMDTGIEGAVPSAPLLGLLRQLKDAELDIAMDDGILVIKGKRKKAEIIMEQEVLLQISEVDEPDEWCLLDKNFIKAINVVCKCVGNDPNKFVLSCIHITDKYIEATDNYQVIRYTIKSGVEKDCLLQGVSIGKIVHFKPVKVGITENWIHFKNKDGLRLSCRKYMEEYPDISAVLKVDGRTINFPSGLDQAVGNASIFSDQNTDVNIVKVRLSAGKIRLEGVGITGKYMEVLKSDYNGVDSEFLINPNLLLVAAKVAKKCTVTDEKLTVSNDDFIYVTCTVKEM